MYKYLIIALLFAGCTKYPDQHPPVACNCKVLTIASNREGDFSVEYKYDDKNRLSRRIVYPNSSSYPDLRIKYDALGRVTQYVANGNPEVYDAMFQEWHFLVYDNKNRVTTDTIYHWGVTGADGLPANVPDVIEYTISVSHFEYDSQNRIVKENDVDYGYDSDGNLNMVLNHNLGWEYDNKVNWNHTDPFLQFLHRDYSRNNRVGASAYNQYGLPLNNLVTAIEPYGMFPGVFTYKCKS